MVLADTSVWIEHFRRGNSLFADLLTEGLVLIHPFIAGELGCGNLKNRARTLADLQALPAVTVAVNSEVSQLLEDRRLWGRGLGWVDVHLLASAMVSNCRLWTLDQRLSQAAAMLGLA
jgi:predicted nucleic acid-binding protein